LILSAFLECTRKYYFLGGGKRLSSSMDAMNGAQVDARRNLVSREKANRSRKKRGQDDVVVPLSKRAKGNDDAVS
jgi:hypothetical protein